MVWYGPATFIQDPDDLKELNRRWLEDIRSFPLVYLKDRWELFKNFLSFGKPEIFYPFQTFIISNSFGLKETGNRNLRVPLKHYIYAFGNSFLFKSLFYIVLSAGLILFHFFRPLPAGLLENSSFFSAWSALLNVLGYFFYAPDYEFRYLYPTVTLSFFSIILLLASFKKEPEVGR